MPMSRTLGALTALSGLLLGCSHAEPAASPVTSSVTPASTSAPLAPAPAEALPLCGDVTAIPLREKLAQLLMVGVTDAADAKAVVTDYHVGGIFIGSWTDKAIFGDLKGITDAASALPLGVSVDEEGGRVSRLADLIGAQPSPRVLAQTKTPDEVYQIALQRGQALRGLGITVDFAPVVDVTEEADDEVIGDRSFGSDPAKVTEYAGAYARGLRDGGVTPVLKHFPGHGHGSGDSHTGAVTTPPLDALKADDLVPYRTLTTEPGVAVMVGHLQVPGLTGTDPASLSGAAYGLLRSGGYGGPGFNGVVYTDDLSSMAAINARYGVAEAVLRALQAGADIALWVTTGEVPAVLDHLEKSVNAGQLAVPRLDDSLRRLAAAKCG
ncbi:beta-glucosidase-like glycosyl hydrolase [Mycolicibacterium canariasense]|uniref:beta-N-acetylhexosaminidase n=1 Tax=Mycolicibacterium canariasense TaxID=228230 RepID=A0A100WJZ8_MYCCR|nr:glycoside hydrolase family 3 N-terminal domain-containing protein [Mycolicibacterium canariasense]MCV7207547.1 glycoside hydrolase family 3 protein [Mycolicibacterium canariasense]ORV08783.1 beta-glucosidase [Mycolicibacterium canariasense]GAS99657.1 beta-glucosidase-like glycosyl hydrolase [Mycolicibacterium canariasense]